MRDDWRDIPGYEGLYCINSEGVVKAYDRKVLRSGTIVHRKNQKPFYRKPYYTDHKGGIIYQYKEKHGHMLVRLFDEEGNGKTFGVHRLVMQTFVGFSDLVVNHINEIPYDNRLENLEYITSKENINYGTARERQAANNRKVNGKPVVCIDPETGKVIKRYECQNDAKKDGFSQAAVSKACREPHRIAYGYHWRFA